MDKKVVIDSESIDITKDEFIASPSGCYKHPQKPNILFTVSGVGYNDFGQINITDSGIDHCNENRLLRKLVQNNLCCKCCRI